ncbi:MAG: nucleotidyltransferase family protein [Lachnospiraceae bacterium]|nr:nucleotidyltransferase family protein [Lachnospiraceae bacterium]
MKMKEQKNKSNTLFDHFEWKPKIMDYLAELILSQFENRTPESIPEGIDIEELVRIANESQMQYIILAALIKLDLPGEVIARIKPYLIRSTMKTLAQVQAAKELQEAFERAGIRNQVLKGSVMKFIYPRPEMREMSDVDIMIYETDFTEAENIMQQKGFDKVQAIKHHVIFRKSPFLICEMHWSLYEQTVDREQYLYYKDQFRAILKEGCKYTYEFSKEDFYVYMISHMAKHFYENGCGIRNLVDIYVYLDKCQDEMNREIIDKELKKCGLSDFEYHVVRLANIWLKKEQSTEFYNQLFHYMLNCGIYGKCENGVWAQVAKQNRNRQESIGNKKYKYYFPALEYMKEYYPWLEKNSWLLPVAWVCRGIHGISNKESLERTKVLGDDKRYQIMTAIYNELNLDFAK